MYDGTVLQYNKNTGYGKILSSCNLLVSVYYENIISLKLYKYLVPNEYVIFDLDMDDLCGPYGLIYKAVDVQGMFHRKLICDLKYQKRYSSL